MKNITILRNVAISGAMLVSTLCWGRSVVDAEPLTTDNSRAVLRSELQRTVFHSVTTGGTAELTWSNESGAQWIGVFTDTTNRVNTAVLSYNGWAVDPTSQVCATDPVLGTYCHYTRVTYYLGYGDVPFGDVQITRNSAKIMTDVTNNPNFVMTSYLADEVTGTVTQGDSAPSGIANIQFSKTSDMNFRSVGVNEMRSPITTSRWGGVTTRNSGFASGNAFGLEFQNVQALIGTGTNIIIDVIKNQ